MISGETATVRTLFAGLLLIGSIFLLGSTSQAVAAGEFEPNDSAGTATGPLIVGQTVSATLETENDADFYKFYVAEGSAQVSLLFIKTGGDQYQTAWASLVDFGGKEVTYETFGYEGESSEILYSVGPGKYYVKVEHQNSWEGQMGYQFQVRGGPDPYDKVETRCKARKKKVGPLLKARNRANKALAKARRQGKGVGKAQARAGKARAAYNQAKRQSDRICFIPR